MTSMICCEEMKVECLKYIVAFIYYFGLYWHTAMQVSNIPFKGSGP